MIEIHKKEDILIPFNQIGDADWKMNTQKIIEAITDNFGDDLKNPVPKEEILALETKLGTTLPKGLKLFYETFGIAAIGEQLQDFNEVGWIKDIWAGEPQYGPDFTGDDNKVLPYLISFSDYLGNGNMFCFHSETKEIYYYDHDDQPYLTKMFDTVDDYFKGCLIFAQADLAENNEAENWTEEIVIQLLGEKTVKKWRY
ncbi:SMI1/KNR4 family protein [Flavobacterium gelatinilyticum]|uniref:SMI1/KNR4 family protein n=1 Tax=Flavobacterium gelatinilyticum TaxID=3003260 RepID=UPI002480F5D9|nr:SMI1/KNR4 family protein [Flavobacterium gelatinilyticum]